MRKIILLAFLFILHGFSAIGQDFVIEEELKVDSLKPVLTLIPFQSNYYRSEIDRSLAKNEGLDYQNLKYRLRNELDRQLYMILSDDFEVNSLLKDNSEEDQKELDYIFYSTASSFTYLESDEKVDRKLLSKGQINSAPVYEGQRYMKTIIHNPELMPTLMNDLPSSYFLFIGELDILLPQSIDEDAHNRNIYVHYTLYNNSGEIIDSGIVSQVLSERKCKSVKDISLDGFAAIAYQLNDRLLEVLN
jgi:hypothetical protein